MKKMVLALVLITGAVFAYAQANLPNYQAVSGRWSMIGGRLQQTDERARLARLNVRVPQASDIMTYEFDAKYEGGAEDGHAGFGIHVFVDNAFSREAWGAGRSVLLWLNYDEKPLTSDIPKGFSAQVYRSLSNTDMRLVESIDLNEFFYYVTDNDLLQAWPIKIVINSNTGETRIYDPVDSTIYYYFYLDRSYLPLRGEWVVLRTNGMKASFTAQ
ncbi:MAG: hypothetical protein FWC03_03690 [Treponema sp.]|nr:hypothetical protein [Treponema sp.]